MKTWRRCGLVTMTAEQYLKGLAETFQEEFDAGETLLIPDR